MEMRCPHSSVRRNRREAGVTIAMVVLCIVVLFIFAALAVDLGILYTARTSAQHAADSAALAGAYTFYRYGNAPDANKAALATTEANQTLSAARILGKPIDASWVTITPDVANRQVTVRVAVPAGNASFGTFFAGIMGIKTFRPYATATAQASDSASGTTCLRPLYMPITAGYTATGTKPAYCTGDPIFDLSTGQLTSPYGKSMVGAEMALWNNIVPGQWGLLDIAGNGGAGVRETLASCSSDYALQAACNAPLPVETKNGRNVGPVEQGVSNLLTGDFHTNVACNKLAGDFVDTFPDPDPERAKLGMVRAVLDPNTGEPCIHAAGSGAGSACIDTSRNIITVAVWNCLPGGETVDPGRQTITVRGFASIFVQCVDKSGKDNAIEGFLMGAGGCGPGTVSGTGPGAIPVRLVQAPGAN